MGLNIAVVGGGLGGLAAALFLRRAGVQATVYEQATQLRETGAGIVVPPNMVRLLAELGLAETVRRVAVQLDAAWEFRRWQDGRVLFVQAMGDACEKLYGAHCFVAHRADLLTVLQDALGAASLRLNHRCAGVQPQGDAVDIHFERRDGGRSTESTKRFDAVIGADGIHSAVRKFIAPEAQARFSGLCAFRCLVPADAAPPMALRPVQTLWLGPGRHLVHYPISAGRLVNIVAIVPACDWQGESWTADGNVADLQQAFAGWDDNEHRIQALLAAATETKRWALVDRTPLPRWTEGRVSLLGDAAHAMLPFFAQGAAQAIEDAAVLADCLSGVPSAQVPQALQRYEARRRPRASQVQLMSRGREIRNHLPDGPEQIERDAGFAQGDPLRQSAWLYGHDVRADAAAH